VNRREAVASRGALLVSACTDTTAPEILPPATHSVYVHCGFENPRSEFGKVPGTQSPYLNPWSAMKTPDRVPLWGEYNEADPIITEKRLELMEGAGIHCAVYQIDTDYRALRMAA
jgi:hypothetical protein